MWNKRRDDEFPPRPPSTPTAPPEVSSREMTPQPVAPVRTQEPELPRGVASIGKSVVIKGQILSREDLFLDGEVEGTVEVPENRVTIGPHGRIQAAVKARDVVVLGAIQGNVDVADKLDIRKEARLVGDIRCGRITIEDGAFFKGSIDIVRSEPKPAPPPPPRSAPAPSAAPSSPVAPLPATVGDNKR